MYGPCSHCDSRFLYTLSDVDGALQFRSFELRPPLRGSDLDKQLKKYFVGRWLADVRHHEVPHAPSGQHEQCYHHIVGHVMDLKKALGQ